MKIKRMLAAVIAAITMSASLIALQADALSKNSAGYYDLSANEARSNLTDAVKTESWTYNYWYTADTKSENPKRKLVPYLTVEAYMFADGTLEVYFYNNHKWKSEEESEWADMLYTIPSTYPIADNNVLLTFRNTEAGGFGMYDLGIYEYQLEMNPEPEHIYSFEDLKKEDFNIYPKEYEVALDKQCPNHPMQDYNKKGNSHFIVTPTVQRHYYRYTYTDLYDDPFLLGPERELKSEQRYEILDYLSTPDHFSDGSLCISALRFKLKDPDSFGETDEYNFHIFGRDLTVSWNKLNSESYAVEAEKRAVEAEEKAAQLEKELAETKKKLNDEITSLKSKISSLETVDYQELLRQYNELWDKYNTERDSWHVDYIEWRGAVADNKRLMSELKSLEIVIKDRDNQIEALKQQLSESSPDLPAPDLNGDGYVTMSDVVWLCRLLAEDVTVTE